MVELTKSDIFDIFYSVQNTTRSGGGKLKSKMARNNVSTKQLIILNSMTDTKMLKYYEKLRDRKSDIAPPPRPR